MTEKEKKLRAAAIGVGTLCAILLIALAYSVVTYTSMLQNKDSQIESLNSQIATLGGKPNPNTSTQVSDLQTQIANLNSQISGLNSQINDLKSIVNLQKSESGISDQTVNQPANSYTSWKISASNAGYFVVNVQSSTTTKTYVEVKYSAYGITYDNRVGVGSGGSASFPVLPANIEVDVGNTNLLNGATETVTITYHY